jgi:hypothetical protein
MTRAELTPAAGGVLRDDLRVSREETAAIRQQVLRLAKQRQRRLRDRTAPWPQQTKREALARLAENGGNIKRTSRETGVPTSTLRAWRERG